ncbi:MAG: isoprenylcysteine carboxylmethyltransferase family protein [Deltaproteobacteria bacterium]|nr:isoprenylcysteine carboxylmethyltransferase family protein [Deltaproteobacteria bacterium]MBW1792855.1 isoprenylcysteine carboxylmethyltransferase family protein [Deltaproteobacteria bacterium]MBW2329917.1 isoprenylcysteine carboxylmethyltransferase family protein [Deltaproteobacteria bacterium]
MKPINIIPPVYLFLSIAIMVLLHFLLPGIKILALPWNLLGVIPLALGIVLNLVADRSFKKHETTVKPVEESTALITSGAFRLSRHPMYLGFVLILFGIAVLKGSLMPYVVLLVFAIFIDMIFIRFEEKKLGQTFGEAWLEYKKNVRRWV